MVKESIHVITFWAKLEQFKVRRNENFAFWWQKPITIRAIRQACQPWNRTAVDLRSKCSRFFRKYTDFIRNLLYFCSRFTDFPGLSTTKCSRSTANAVEVGRSA